MNKLCEGGGGYSKAERAWGVPEISRRLMCLESGEHWAWPKRRRGRWAGPDLQDLGLVKDLEFYLIGKPLNHFE